MQTPNGPVYVDNTTLRAVQTCECQAALRHVLGYTGAEDAHNLQAGINAHEVLADYLRGEPAARCLRKFGLLHGSYSEAHDLANPEGGFYRLSWENTHRILAEWFERHPLAGFPFVVKPSLVEVGFEIPLATECVCGHDESRHDATRGCAYRGRCGCDTYRPAFVFWGRLDAIVQAQHDGAIYVLDHKTTGRLTPYWTERFRMDAQMSGYTWAAGRTLGMPVTGVYINAIEFAKLPSDPSRKCKDHGTVYAECGSLHAKSELLIYTRSPDQLNEWRSMAISVAKRYRALLERVKTLDDVLTHTRLEGTLTNACGFCDFQKFCQAGRPVQYAESMLVYSPWQPYSTEQVIKA